MTLKEYFLMGLRNGLGYKLHWMNKLFFEIIGEDKLEGYDLEPYFKDNKMYFLDNKGYTSNELNKEIEITDYKPGRAPLHFRDAFILNKGDIINYNDSKSIITTYGNIYANHLCLIEPFDDIFDFKPGLFLPQKYEDRIMDLLLDDPIDMDMDNPTKAEKPNIYVWQYLMFSDNALFLTSFADGLVTSTTERSIKAHPDRNKVRDKWLKENEHRLNDPVAVAELSSILKKLDNEFLEGDESAGYYASDGKLAGGRRKMHYFFGGEDPFGDGSKVELIPKSLEEGVDIDKLPVMNSAARAGSYNRGFQTALGGVATKVMYRMAGTIRITEDDCESLVGVPTLIDEFNKKDLVGYSQIVGNKVIKITEEIVNANLNKVINVRSPVTCKTEGKNVCKVCVGDGLSENPAGIPAAVASMGGVLMMIFMKGMHTNEISTKHWDYNKWLS